MSKIDDEKNRLDDSETVPTLIWRRILRDIDFGIKDFNRQMEDFLSRPSTGVKNDPERRNTVRSNIRSAIIERDNMTWGNLMNGLRFLNPIRVKITIECQWRFRTPTLFDLVIYKEEKRNKKDAK